jgi:hypothetical protein
MRFMIRNLVDVDDASPATAPEILFDDLWIFPSTAPEILLCWWRWLVLALVVPQRGRDDVASGEVFPSVKNQGIEPEGDSPNTMCSAVHTRKQRGRSNLGGAPAPPPPWRPWTRGETLPPSREEVKEEEEGGGLSPPLSRWCRNTAEAIIVWRRSTPTTLSSSSTHPSPSPSIFSGPLSRNPLYPLLEHGALCFILLYNDVLPSYDVWVDFRCPIGNWWIAMVGLNCLWLCCCLIGAHHMIARVDHTIGLVVCW